MPTVTLTGKPATLTMPSVCAHCGAPASERLRIEKVFSHVDEDSGARTSTVEICFPPFCNSCMTVHRQQAKTVDIVEKLLLMFRSIQILPAILSGLACVFFTRFIFQDLFRAELRSALLWCLPVAFFGAVSIGCFAVTRSRTRHFTAVPDTSVTSAFGFSNDLSKLFEERHHEYTLRNSAFASAFTAANFGRIWSAQQKAHASFKRRILYVVLGVLGSIVIAYALYDEYFN